MGLPQPTESDWECPKCGIESHQGFLNQSHTDLGTLSHNSARTFAYCARCSFSFPVERTH